MFAICRRNVLRNISTARLRCITNPRARSTAPQQPCSQIGMRRYSSYRDTLMTFPARLKKIFKSQTDGEKARTRSKENRPGSQQVNAIITEMIQQQKTLDSMLYVTGKLLPKMSLADRAITQQILTEKMYSEIVANSPVFIGTGYYIEIHNALLSEGQLDKAVEPLVSSQVFEELIKGMVEFTDDMTNWQVVNLFLNLQLLNCNKESKEMFKLFDRIYVLDSREFTVGEMVMFLHGFNMYKPSYQQPIFMLSEWCKNNKVDLNNSHWFEVLRLLHEFRNRKGAGTDGPKLVFEQITSRIQEEEDGISGLDLYQLLVLTKSLSDWQFQKLYFPDLSEDTVSGLLKKMTNHVRSMIDDIGDMEIVYLYQIWNSFWFEAVGDVVGSVIVNKYLKSPMKGELKYDVFLSASLIMSSVLNYPDFLKMIRESVDFKEKTVECLKYSNAYFMRYSAKRSYLHFHICFYDVIIERIHVFAEDGVVELDKLPTLKKYLCLTLCSLHNVKSCDQGDKKIGLEIRDRFLEEYLDHYVYDKEFMLLGIRLCLYYPKMTPISITFLENVNNIGDDAWLYSMDFRDYFAEKYENAKYKRYRRYLCKVNYSRSQSALSKLESDSLLLTCNTYVPPDSKFPSKTVNLAGLHGSVSEPALNVLTTEMLRTLSGVKEDGHKRSMNDSKTGLDYWHSMIAEGYHIQRPSYILSLCADCFFSGYRPGDDVKVQTIVKSIEPLVKDKAQRRVLYEQDVDWTQYFKDYDYIFKKVVMKYSTLSLVKEAFGIRAGHRIFTDDKLYLDIVGGESNPRNYSLNKLELRGFDSPPTISYPYNQIIQIIISDKECMELQIKGDVVLLFDASDRPVPFSISQLMQAEKLGLKKVVFMQFAYQSSVVMVVRERLVKDLQKAGYKCVIIWNGELQGLGNQVWKSEDQIRLIKSKVHNKNSIVNTGPEINYDPQRIMEGPYKKYFTGFKKGKQRLLEN